MILGREKSGTDNKVLEPLTTSRMSRFRLGQEPLPIQSADVGAGHEFPGMAMKFTKEQKKFATSSKAKSG